MVKEAAYTGDVTPVTDSVIRLSNEAETLPRDDGRVSFSSFGNGGRGWPHSVNKATFVIIVLLWGSMSRH